MAGVGRQADEVHEPRGVFVVCDVGVPAGVETAGTHRT